MTLDNACAAESQGAEGLPLDMYVIYDQSGSMDCPVPAGGTRWSAVTSAFEGFLQTRDAAGIGVGIQYFGLQATGQKPMWKFGGGGGFGGFGGDQSSCTAADYAKPEIEIAPLSSNAPALISSLGAHMPSSCTPTKPALQGGIDHATQWKKSHPSHAVIVVLVTDGLPNCCDSTVENVAAIAATGAAATPKIPTFVVGITSPGVACDADPNPPSKDKLDQVAKAGGTNEALVVDLTQNPAQQILDSMNKIRGLSTLPCEYRIPAPPEGGMLDYHRVNVTYTPGHSTKKGVLLQAKNQGACDGAKGGWYYDDPSSPTKIQLCDATCKQVTSDSAGSVDVLLGCQTEELTPH